jgi:putative RNA 2'-phosphotransferase
MKFLLNLTSILGREGFAMMNDLIKESKRLAYLLRHSCLPDHNGWVSIDLLIREHGFTIEGLMQVVSDDAKGRFELSGDGLTVRAIYGHSVDVDLELVPSSPPAVLFHGSGAKYIEGIMREGLTHLPLLTYLLQCNHQCDDILLLQILS